MPITVQYQPNLNMLSEAAYTAGAGQFRQRQQQVALQEQARLRDDMMRQQALEQAAMQRAADMQARQMQAEQENMLRAAELGQRAQQAQQRFGLDQMRANAYVQQTQQNNPVARQQFTWDQASAASMEREARDARTALSKLPLSPDGQRAARELDSTYKAIQARRGTMMPRQYVQALGQWMDKFQESDVLNQVAPPPTAADLVATKTVPVKEGSNDYWTVKENGEMSLQRGTPPPGAKKDKTPEIFDPTTGAAYDFDTYRMKNHEVVKQDMDRHRKILLDIAKANVGEDGTVKVPSEDKVIEAVRQEHERLIKGVPKAKILDPVELGILPGRPQQMPPEPAAPTSVVRFGRDPKTGKIVRLQ